VLIHARVVEQVEVVETGEVHAVVEGDLDIARTGR
jgi:hypothetical protein